jgi:hypothetical protein
MSIILTATVVGPSSADLDLAAELAGQSFNNLFDDHLRTPSLFFTSQVSRVHILNVLIRRAVKVHRNRVTYRYPQFPQHFFTFDLDLSTKIGGHFGFSDLTAEDQDISKLSVFDFHAFLLNFVVVDSQAATLSPYIYPFLSLIHLPSSRSRSQQPGCSAGGEGLKTDRNYHLFA